MYAACRAAGAPTCGRGGAGRRLAAAAAAAGGAGPRQRTRGARGPAAARPSGGSPGVGLWAWGGRCLAGGPTPAAGVYPIGRVRGGRPACWSRGLASAAARAGRGGGVGGARREDRGRPAGAAAPLRRVPAHKRRGHRACRWSGRGQPGGGLFLVLFLHQAGAACCRGGGGVQRAWGRSGGTRRRRPPAAPHSVDGGPPNGTASGGVRPAHPHPVRQPSSVSSSAAAAAPTQGRAPRKGRVGAETASLPPAVRPSGEGQRDQTSSRQPSLELHRLGHLPTRARARAIAVRPRSPEPVLMGDRPSVGRREGGKNKAEERIKCKRIKRGWHRAGA